MLSKLVHHLLTLIHAARTKGAWIEQAHIVEKCQKRQHVYRLDLFYPLQCSEQLNTDTLCVAAFCLALAFRKAWNDPTSLLNVKDRGKCCWFFHLEWVLVGVMEMLISRGFLYKYPDGFSQPKLYQRTKVVNTIFVTANSTSVSSYPM